MMPLTKPFDNGQTSNVNDYRVYNVFHKKQPL